MNKTEQRKIRIFDTTLRDGEQSPGASMNLNEKMELALALQDLGVDIIEAGFPIASPEDFRSVREIAKSVRGSVICGLARCNDDDIDRAWEAVKHAERARLHVFLATSAIHREFKLRMTPEEIIKRTVAGVKRAAGYCEDVEFSPEDAARTEHDFLCEVVEAAIAAGATTVNIPDTVGYATPEQMGKTIRVLRERVPNIDKAVISVHCHNDLGLAVANSLAAVENGAGQVECTINGIGERAGNCSLEEIVMAMRTRGDYYNCDTNINTQRLVFTSRLVESITGIQVQRNKAIVGRNAFAHEAGIHQHGMLSDSRTYEIIRPEDVGFTKTELVIGKHSGRAALKDRIDALGFHLNDEQVDEVFEKFKKLADEKKDIYDSDIASLVHQVLRTAPDGQKWKLVSFESISGTNRSPYSKITIEHGGEEITKEWEVGDGPIDAALSVIEQITGKKLECKNFEARSASTGRDAPGEAVVEVECNECTFLGQGSSTNTIEATILAILDAVNAMPNGNGNGNGW